MLFVKHNKYLDNLAIQSEERLLKSYKISNLHQFSNFEVINAFLINQAIEKEWNLLINIPLKDIKINFYLPTFFIISLICFSYNYVKNDIDISTQIKNGNIIQDLIDNKLYSVEDVGLEWIKIIGSGTRTIRLKYFTNGRYIITNYRTLNQKVSSKIFKAYQSFFNQVFGSDSYLPSKFNLKSIIITNKEIIEEVKKKSTYNYKAFPFQYITSNGVRNDNLPIDPLIYIVHDYSTCKEYILDKRECELESIIFIGDTKYRDLIPDILNEKAKGKFKSCVFIGSEEVSNLSLIRKWGWKTEELSYLRKVTLRDISPILIEHQELTDKVRHFQKVIREIEQKYTIDVLSEYYNKYVREVLRTLLERQADELYSRFEDNTILVDKFRDIGLDDYWLYLDNINSCFLDLIEIIKKDNKKHSHLISKREHFDYIIVPSNLLGLWQREIKTLGYLNTKLCSFNDFCNSTDLKNKKILLLGLYNYSNYKQLKKIVIKEGAVFILVYSEEMELLKSYDKLYQKEMENEFKSKDREKLSGIKYPEDTEEEKLNSLMERLINREDADYIEKDDSYEEVFYEIIFDDNEIKEIEANRLVNLKEGNSLVKTRVSCLKHGDQVIVYDNISREKLNEIAKIKHDQILQEIKQYSNLWKNALRQYCEFTLDSDLTRLHAVLNINGLDIGISTLKKWMNLKDKDLFPCQDKTLYMIKKTINNKDLSDNFVKLIKNKKTYRSIMIDIGKSLSKEIKDYIESDFKEKGDILSYYSDEEIKELVVKNAPSKKIKNIKIKEIAKEDELRSL